MENVFAVAIIVVIIAVVIFGLRNGLKGIKSSLPNNTFSEEAIKIVERITVIIEKETKEYFKTVDLKGIRLTDIDDVLIDLFFIVRSSIGEELLNDLEQINNRELDEPIDVDKWIQDLVREKIVDMIGIRH